MNVSLTIRVFAMGDTMQRPVDWSIWNVHATSPSGAIPCRILRRGVAQNFIHATRRLSYALRNRHGLWAVSESDLCGFREAPYRQIPAFCPISNPRSQLLCRLL